MQRRVGRWPPAAQALSIDEAQPRKDRRDVLRRSSHDEKGEALPLTLAHRVRLARIAVDRARCRPCGMREPGPLFDAAILLRAKRFIEVWTVADRWFDG